MGTRGVWGFIINGKEKITYNHFDSYPEGLGKDIFVFVANTPIEKMIDIAEKIIMVGEQRPSVEQVEECKKFADTSVGVQDLKDWYCLLRNSQGNPSAYLYELKYMIDNHTFLENSLFCEWAYIINLDTKKVEVYKGFNQNKDARGRYAGFRNDLQDYCGVALITEVPIDTIKKWVSEEILDRLSKYEKNSLLRSGYRRKSSFKVIPNDFKRKITLMEEEDGKPN
jgi:hypothetical protein